MCKLKTLYAGETGYALLCEDCGYVQLGFGTTMLTLSRDDFSIFVAMVAQRAEALVTFWDNRKSIVMPTPMSCCQVLLTEAELADLNQLLQLADNEIKTDALLRLFQPGDRE